MLSAGNRSCIVWAEDSQLSCSFSITFESSRCLFIVVLSSYNLLHGLKKKDFSAHITTVFALETLCFFHETELLTKHLSLFELFFCWSPPALISKKSFWLDFTVSFHNLLTYFSFCSCCTWRHSFTDSQTIPASTYIQKNLKACVHLLVVFRS